MPNRMRRDSACEIPLFDIFVHYFAYSPNGDSGSAMVEEQLIRAGFSGFIHSGIEIGLQSVHTLASQRQKTFLSAFPQYFDRAGF